MTNIYLRENGLRNYCYFYFIIIIFFFHAELFCYIWTTLQLLISCRTHCFMTTAVPSRNSFTKTAYHLIFINAKESRTMLFLEQLKKSIWSKIFMNDIVSSEDLLQL